SWRSARHAGTVASLCGSCRLALIRLRRLLRSLDLRGEARLGQDTYRAEGTDGAEEDREDDLRRALLQHLQEHPDAAGEADPDLGLVDLDLPGEEEDLAQDDRREGEHGPADLADQVQLLRAQLVAPRDQEPDADRERGVDASSPGREQRPGR